MFAAKIDDIYQAHFHLMCPLCHETYDQVHNIPMVLCFRQHLCCFQCMENKLFKAGQLSAQCPQCRETVRRDHVFKLRIFDNLVSYNDEILKSCVELQSSIDKKSNDLNQTLQDIMDNQQGAPLIKESKEKCIKYEQLLLDEAANYFFEGKYERTIMICRNIIQTNPQVSKTYYGFGGKEEFIGYEEDYIKQCYRNYKENTGHQSPYDLLSLALLLSSDYEDDKEWFIKQLQKHPNHYQLRFGLGLLHGNFDKSQEAVENYQIARKNNYKFEKAHQCIAFQYYSRGNFMKAREYAQLSLNKNPQNPFSLFIKAMTEEEQSEMIQTLSSLVKESINYLVPIHELGQIYFNINDYERAKECFEECLKKSKCYDSARIGLARCSVQMKQSQRAIELLDDLVKKEESEEILMILALAYSKIGKTTVAHEMIEKCKSLNPDNDKVDLLLAQVYTAEEQYDRAIDTYKLVLQKTPNNHEIFKFIALTFLKKHDYYNAADWCDQYKKYEPDDLEIQLLRAHSYFEQKMNSQALELYLQCLKSNEMIVEAYPNVVSIYQSQHMYEEALFWAKKWNEVEPECPENWEAISQISKTIGNMIRKKEWQPKKKRNMS